VHVDPPAEHKAYVHRSGRTARAGNEGIVVTLATPDQQGSVRSLMKLAGIKPILRPVKPGNDAIGEVSGPSVPLVHTARVVEAAEPTRRHRGPRSPRDAQTTRGTQPRRPGQGSRKPSSRRTPRG